MSAVHVYSGAADVPADLGATVVTIGNFDGVHRGHHAVLTKVIDEARRRDAKAVAVTFEPHPLAVLHPDRAPAAITSLSDRLQLLAATGLDAVLVLEFTKEFAAQTPEQFVERTFVEGLGAVAVVVGADMRFGVHNSGNVATLRELGATHGFDVVVIDDLGTPEHQRWSSSMVREQLVAGDVAGASEVLARPHRVTGVVVHGHHRGRELGFPTANLGADSDGLVPAEGVYAGWLVRLDLPDDARDRTLPAAISVGTNPTFDTHDRRTVEAYVLDRDDLDLYDERVAVEFVERLRPTLKFSGIEPLIEQMSEDVARCRELLARVVPLP